MNARFIAAVLRIAASVHAQTVAITAPFEQSLVARRLQHFEAVRKPASQNEVDHAFEATMLLM